MYAPDNQSLLHGKDKREKPRLQSVCDVIAMTLHRSDEGLSMATIVSINLRIVSMGAAAAAVSTCQLH